MATIAPRFFVPAAGVHTPVSSVSGSTRSSDSATGMHTPASSVSGESEISAAPAGQRSASMTPAPAIGLPPVATRRASTASLMDQIFWRDVVSAIREHSGTVHKREATRAHALQLIQQLHDEPLDGEEAAKVFSRLLAQTDLPANASAARSFIATEVGGARRHNPIGQDAAQETKVSMLPDDLQAVIAANRRAGHTRLLSEADLAALSDEQRMQLGLFLSAREPQPQPATDGDAALAHAIANMSESELAAFDRQQAHQARTVTPARPHASRRNSTGQTEILTLPEDLQLAIAINRSLQNHAPNLNEQDLAALSDEQRMQLGLFLSSREHQQHVEINDDAVLAHAIAKKSEADLTAFASIQTPPTQIAVPWHAISGYWQGTKLWDLESWILNAVHSEREARRSNESSAELTEEDYLAMAPEAQQFFAAKALFRKTEEKPAPQLFPDRIRNHFRIVDARIDAADIEEVAQRWKTAATLLENSANEKSQSENLSQHDHELSIFSIPDDLDWNQFVVDSHLESKLDGLKNDSIFHALAGTALTYREILDIREKVAAIRTSENFRATSDVDQVFPESKNNQELRNAIAYTIGLDEFELNKFIPRNMHISDEIFAAFQACPGFLEGHDTIAQWTLLQENKGKTVLCLDVEKNSAVFLHDGRVCKVEMRNDESFESLISRHITEDNRNLVLKCSGGDWQRVRNASVSEQ